MAPRSSLGRLDFEIGIICALPLEAHAVRAIFDEVYGDDSGSGEDSDTSEDDDIFRKDQWDKNVYTAGKIGRHNVVLAHMPGMGKARGASVAVYFKNSFKRLQLALLVGICGGVPKANKVDVLLGDVVIGTNVIQHDFGRQYENEVEMRDDPEEGPSAPGPEIRAFINKLKAERGNLEEKTFENLIALLNRPGYESASYPGALEDKLFPSNYPHKHHNPKDCSCIKDDKTCQNARKSSCEQLECDKQLLEPRSRLQEVGGAAQAGNDAQPLKPVIHFGPIACGDQVMKSAPRRNAIAETKGAIAFDMESAGVWDYLPCIVVKGVCDYADSHKNKNWQEYAAATATACAKAILSQWAKIDKPSQPGQGGGVTFNNFKNNVQNQVGRDMRVSGGQIFGGSIGTVHPLPQQAQT